MICLHCRMAATVHPPWHYHASCDAGCNATGGSVGPSHAFPTRGCQPLAGLRFSALGVAVPTARKQPKQESPPHVTHHRDSKPQAPPTCHVMAHMRLTHATLTTHCAGRHVARVSSVDTLEPRLAYTLYAAPVYAHRSTLKASSAPHTVHHRADRASLQCVRTERS